MKHVALILDVPNKNNRIYRTEVIEKAIPAAKELIKEERLVITAEQPPDWIVPINDIVAEVKDIFIDSIRLVIDFEFVENPLANAVQEELNRGAIAVRPSGSGTVFWDYEKEVYIVNDDYEVTCFNFTYNPS